MNAVKIRSSIMLLITALIWGMAFVSQQAGMDHMGPFTFSAVRNLIACAAVLPVLCVFRRRTPKEQRKPIFSKVSLLGGLGCGLSLTAGALFQQVGLTMTTVGKAGFITTLYIIFTPVLGVFVKKKVPKIVWLSTAMAAVGLYLLCMTEGFSGINPGDVLMLMCAVCYAVQIMTIDHISDRTDGVAISVMQFIVCFIISTSLALIFEQPSVEGIIAGAVPLLYTGVLSSGVAYTLQIIGQKGLDPTIAALIMSLESVVATIAGFVAYKIGWLSTDQTMTARQIIGCAVVFAAVILVQLPWENFKLKKNKQKAEEHL